MQQDIISQTSQGVVTVIGANGEHIQTVEAVVNGKRVLIPVSALNQIPHIRLDDATTETPYSAMHSKAYSVWMHPATPIVIGVCLFLIGLGAYVLAKATTTPPLPVATPAPEPRVIVIPQPVAPAAAPSNQRCLLACF